MKIIDKKGDFFAGGGGGTNMYGNVLIKNDNIGNLFHTSVFSQVFLVNKFTKLGIVQASSLLPLFRKFSEIRKFQIERKNFRKNLAVCLDKNNA